MKKPYRCKICGKRFASIGSRNTHMRIHSENPFSCAVCGKEFSRNEHLKLHMRTHTGEKPYYCHVCGKGFTIKGNCLKHVEVHSKDGTREHRKNSKLLLQLSAESEIPYEKCQSDAVMKFVEPIVEIFVDDGIIEGVDRKTVSDLQDAICNMSESDSLSGFEKISDGLLDADGNNDKSDWKEPTIASRYIPNPCGNFAKPSTLESNICNAIVKEECPLPVESVICSAIVKEECSLPDSLCDHALDQIGSFDEQKEKEKDTLSYLNRTMIDRVHLQHNVEGVYPYKCTVCERKFKTIVDFNEHIREHSGKPVKCKICCKQFTHHASLKYHNVQCSLKNPNVQCHSEKNKKYRCKICGTRFTQIGSRNKHMLIHSGGKPYSCAVCRIGFARKEHLKLHLRTHTGEKPYVCPVCGKGFTIKGNCLKHIKVHSNDGTRKHRKDSKLQLQHSTEPEIPYEECESDMGCKVVEPIVENFVTDGIIDGVDKKTVSDLQDVICKMSENNSLSCFKKISNGLLDADCNDDNSDWKEPTIASQQYIPNTNGNFTKPSTLESNICNAIVKEECPLPVESVICSAIVKEECPLPDSLCDHALDQIGSFDDQKEKDTLSYLNRTMIDRVHLQHNVEGVYPYKCTVCDQNFETIVDFNEHLQEHSVEKSFKCKICSKQFTHHDSLKYHNVQCHSEKNDKPYQCNICETRFTQNGSLSTHMRIHSGEKPFPCAVCGKGFLRNEHLKLHMRIHTGEKPYVCHLCGKGFTIKGNQLRHVKVHFNDGARKHRKDSKLLLQYSAEPEIPNEEYESDAGWNVIEPIVEIIEGVERNTVLDIDG